MNGLKMKCIQQRIAVLTILAIVGVALICRTGFAAFKSLPPTELNSESDFESLAGKYVYYEMEMPVDYYESLGKVNNDTGEETIEKYGYFIYDADGDFFFGIVRDEKYDEEMAAMIEDVWSYMTYETDDLPESVVVAGTLTEMDSEDASYFDQTLYEYTYYGFTSNAKYYYIYEGHIGSFEVSDAWILTAIGLVFIIIGVIWLFVGLGSWDRNIKKYITAHPECTRSQLETDATVGKVMNNGRTIIGRNWIFAADSVINVASLDKLCWGYYYQRSGSDRTMQMCLFFADGEEFSVNATEENTKEMLTYLYEQLPYVVVGYKKEWDELYNKQREEFLGLRYYPGKQM